MSEVPVPPHQDGDDRTWSTRGDAAGYFPTAESARSYAAGIGEAPYHRDRLRALRELVDATALGGSDHPVAVLDFGVGDGGELKALGLSLARVIGVDVSAAMVELAAQAFDAVPFVGVVGSVDALQAVEDASVDLVTCVNTLGYLDEEQQAAFLAEAARVTRRDGHLIVVTGNELFDLFALNSGTAEFFDSRLGFSGAADLLTEGSAARFRNASRRNPLNFGIQLRAAGFEEVHQSFASWHREPPVSRVRAGADLVAAREEARDYSWTPQSLSPLDRWRQLVQCSIFGSVSRRAG